MLWVGRWEVACVALWTHVVFTPWANAQGQSGHHLSVEDIWLLKDEPSPKCLTRMLDGIAKEFTCFFMTEDNSAYDFYYTIDNPPRRTRCEMQVQRPRDGGFLHICSFPQSDIFLFDEIPLEVVERNKNSSLYSRTVTVEDNILEPPSNISIVQNDNIGELLLSWWAKCAFTVYYKIKFSSKSMNQTVIQGHNKFKETLDGLAPGEEVKVQISVRCSPSRTTGHWSHWSPLVNAVVPQSADDISLKCTTKDLLNITCQWDMSVFNMEAGYTLFYKMGSSEGHSWTQWTECFPETISTDQCGFQGNMHKRIRVKLSSPTSPFNRTFYSEDFKLNTIIQTPPPSHLKQNETDKLCVSWNSPLTALSSHLLYELNYRPATQKHWMTISSNSPETAVCLKLPWGSEFDVKVRAKPSGPVYSGQWSDWSDVLTADVPAQSSSQIMLLIHCSPVLLLVLAVFFMLLFSKYLKRLKQYLWPPVPNLDKVLQGFLMDLNQHKWDAPVTGKQFFGETAASVVEVLSSNDDMGLEEASEKSAGLLSSSDTSYSSMGQEDDSTETELYPDYVALNKNTMILSTKENSYIYEDLVQNKDKQVNAKKNSNQSSKESLLSEHGLGSEFLNHSYLFLATDDLGRKEREQRGQENIYTNMPCN